MNGRFGSGPAAPAHRRLWPIALEAFGSAVWVLIASVAALFAVIDALVGGNPASVTLAFAWGVAICVVASLQLGFALMLEARYDWSAMPTLMLGPLYPLGYWLLNAVAVIRSGVPALLRGARAERVVWNISREAAHPPPDRP